MDYVRFFLCKFCIFVCFFSQHVFAAEPTLPQGLGVPVLLYHKITDEYDPTEIYSISKEQFRQHLGAIKLAGFKTITIRDLHDYFYRAKPLPKKSFMITFDDGRKEVFQACDPILKDLGFTAVMFVNTLMQEKKLPGYLSWEKLDAMYQTGRWGIQAHGYEYHNLIPVDAKGGTGNFGSNLKWLETEDRLETIDELKARLHKDLVIQKEMIESHIRGEKVLAFSFPFGDWGTGSENLDPYLAIALNYAAVKDVYPLSFGNVEFDPAIYRATATPHQIVRLIDNGSITPQQIIQVLEASTL